jgi:asparagine synthase (glutamine-hydrolysing)
MVSNLQHRGPDGSGTEWVSVSATGDVVLGHTRLAIIDLSPSGSQPMASSDGSLHVTFNGEIYNFRELRAELGATGWLSQSDTEVLVRAYARWGIDCVHHLRGMFAFAIWDGHRRELFLARDRLGIKPLYYCALPAQGLFVFASEVRALLASGVVPRRLDKVGLVEYLNYQAVPGPRTLVQGTSMLPPGSWAVIDENGRIRQQRYWDLLENASPAAAQATPSESERTVGDLLHESVAAHLVSDVPVGAFLSGGIDSSAIVGLMRETGQTPCTFSVRFAEQAYDETSYARAIAERFRTTHTEVTLSESRLLELLPDALSAMDQPTGDGVNTYVVSRAVRETGIKVALSGLGGDELFGGYPTFARLQRSAAVLRAWGRTPTLARSMLAQAVRTIGRSSIAASKSAALVASDGQLANLYPPLRQVLSKAQVRALLQPDLLLEVAGSPDPYAQLLGAACGKYERSVFTWTSYAEARTYMHDVLLRDTDQMSMAHALEVRVPLLDHVVVEYVMGLDDQVKQPNGTPKRLLVDSLRGLLPESIVQRRKQGFTLPFEPWMRAELRQFCADRLAPDRLGARGILRPEQLASVWQSFLDGRPDMSWSRVWILVVLEAWLEQNGLEA